MELTAYLDSYRKQGLSFLDNDIFYEPGAHSRLTVYSEVPLNVMDYWHNIFSDTVATNPADMLLEKEVEREIFLRLNYAKKNFIRLLNRVTLNEDSMQLCSKYIDIYESARQYLMYYNFGLVRQAASNVGGITNQDLFSVGNVALLRAIEKFDINRNVKFSTYAFWAIQREIYGLLNKKKKYSKEIYVEFEEGSYFDIDSSILEDIHDMLDYNMADLDEMEIEFIQMRYFDNMILDDISKSGTSSGKRVTKERVRQIINKGLSKLRDYWER